MILMITYIQYNFFSKSQQLSYTYMHIYSYMQHACYVNVLYGYIQTSVIITG